MNLEIPSAPNEEARLTAAAKQTGLAPAELLKRLAPEHLPLAPANADDELDAKLRQWQEQDGTPLMPNVSAQELFAKWAAEDAQMTEAEREAEDRLWEEIERGLAENYHNHEPGPPAAFCGGRLMDQHSAQMFVSA